MMRYFFRSVVSGDEISHVAFADPPMDAKKPLPLYPKKLLVPVTLVMLIPVGGGSTVNTSVSVSAVKVLSWSVSM